MYMKHRYISLYLIVCLISGLVLCGCNSTKKTKIVINHESKYTQFMKKNIPSHIIDLSDGNSVNFDYNIGPQDPSGPSFRLITVDK